MENSEFFKLAQELVDEARSEEAQQDEPPPTGVALIKDELCPKAGYGQVGR